MMADLLCVDLIASYLSLESLPNAWIKRLLNIIKKQRES